MYFDLHEEFKKRTGSLFMNVTLRRVCGTIVVGKSNKCYKFRVCVCSLSYPARKNHAPYHIVICGLLSSTVFFHIIS
jgi:hypothetical protein